MHDSQRRLACKDRFGSQAATNGLQGLGQASALNNPLLNITMFAPVNSAFTAPLPSVCRFPYIPGYTHQQYTCKLHCIQGQSIPYSLWNDVAPAAILHAVSRRIVPSIMDAELP